MFKLFELFREKKEKPDIFNHVTQSVSIGDIRRFRMPSDGAYDSVVNGNIVHLLINTLTVLEINSGNCRCLVNWYGNNPTEKDFGLGYLEMGTLKV